MKIESDNGRFTGKKRHQQLQQDSVKVRDDIVVNLVIFPVVTSDHKLTNGINKCVSTENLMIIRNY